MSERHDPAIAIAMDYSILMRRVLSQFEKGLITPDELKFKMLLLTSRHDANMQQQGHFI